MFFEISLLVLGGALVHLMLCLVRTDISYQLLIIYLGWLASWWFFEISLLVLGGALVHLMLCLVRTDISCQLLIINR